MQKTNSFFLAILMFGLTAGAHGQAPQLRVVVGPVGDGSDSVIAIPAERSWTGPIRIVGQPVAKGDPGKVAAWLTQQAAINGLQSNGIHPWHIVIEYQELDSHEGKVHNGVFDEIWAGPTKYRASYKSDNLNQTDYATDHGLFRLGDQRWPHPAESAVRDEVVAPFAYAQTFDDTKLTSAERTFGSHSLNCTTVDGDGEGKAHLEFCFDHDSPALRYTRGFGWNQTAYNDIKVFQGRNVARDVVVTDAGKPYLNLHVTTLTEISNLDEKQLLPPPDAVSLLDKPVSGVPVVRKSGSLEWPAELRQQRFSVNLEVLIGKDGHVKEAHAISGPPAAYKAAENSVKKWTFRPYRVLGQPVEVELHTQLNSN
jgi:hypothetical protein